MPNFEAQRLRRKDQGGKVPGFRTWDIVALGLAFFLSHLNSSKREVMNKVLQAYTLNHTPQIDLITELVSFIVLACIWYRTCCEQTVA